jgi:hypothetical protein
MDNAQKESAFLKWEIVKYPFVGGPYFWECPHFGTLPYTQNPALAILVLNQTWLL